MYVTVLHPQILFSLIVHLNSALSIGAYPSDYCSSECFKCHFPTSLQTPLPTFAALRIISRQIVAEGEKLRLRCMPDPSDRDVWAYRLTFTSSFNSFQVLRRVGEAAMIYLDAQGYPSRFEKETTEGDLKIGKRNETEGDYLFAELRVKTASGDLNATCEALQVSFQC